MSKVKAVWTNEDNFSIETTASDYIKREDAIDWIKSIALILLEVQKTVEKLSELQEAREIELRRRWGE